MHIFASVWTNTLNRSEQDWRNVSASRPNLDNVKNLSVQDQAAPSAPVGARVSFTRGGAIGLAHRNIDYKRSCEHRGAEQAEMGDSRPRATLQKLNASAIKYSKISFSWYARKTQTTRIGGFLNYCEVCMRAKPSCNKEGWLYLSANDHKWIFTGFRVSWSHCTAVAKFNHRSDAVRRI